MRWTRQQRRSQWQDGGRYETWLCPSCGRTVEARRPGRRAEALGLYRLKSVEELLCPAQVRGWIAAPSSPLMRVVVTV
jgi:hypothetical protein